MDIVYILHIKYKVFPVKKDSFCASHFLYLPYLTKIIGIDFKYAVLNLYYQTIS